jgi:isohexenylglutaconyl-CoA hydratase
MSMPEVFIQPPLETLATMLEGSVLHVTLNRPQVRNAMSLAMVTELLWVLAQAESGGEVRVIVLRGAGGHFCAGADLKDMALARMSAMQSGKSDGATDPIAQANGQFGELCVAYAKSPLAVVAVLEGTVMGGGLGLACVADVALASETAVFRLPETSLGMVPAQIAPFLVERLGYSQAKRLAVTGGQFTAPQAQALGLVHDVHTQEQINAAVVTVVAGILKCAPDALAQTKALMVRARITPADQLVPDAAAIFARAAQGPEGMEGVSAFLQKRQPSWVPQ